MGGMNGGMGMMGRGGMPGRGGKLKTGSLQRALNILYHRIQQ
jgi:hypothetical protein